MSTAKHAIVTGQKDAGLIAKNALDSITHNGVLSASLFAEKVAGVIDELNALVLSIQETNTKTAKYGIGAVQCGHIVDAIVEIKDSANEYLLVHFVCDGSLESFKRCARIKMSRTKSGDNDLRCTIVAARGSSVFDASSVRILKDGTIAKNAKESECKYFLCPDDAKAYLLAL